MNFDDLIVIIDVFPREEREDYLIVSIPIGHIPICEFCKIFTKKLLTGGGAFLVKKKHEEPLRQLTGIKINTKKCDAFIGIRVNNDPSKY